MGRPAGREGGDNHSRCPQPIRCQGDCERGLRIHAGYEIGNPRLDDLVSWKASEQRSIHPDDATALAPRPERTKT